MGPEQYHKLYKAVFDALQHLSTNLRQNHPQCHLADLYALVQVIGNIIPRLYLMITVGTAYMSIKDAPVKDIMRDMMEMSKGVQDPVRGLFLRCYLIAQAQNYLPEGSGDGSEGNLQLSINFILTNLVEMNKLWARLKTSEREELHSLVGNNLLRFSHNDHYRQFLSPLLEQVEQCEDAPTQECLLKGQ